MVKKKKRRGGALKWPDSTEWSGRRWKRTERREEEKRRADKAEHEGRVH